MGQVGLYIHYIHVTHTPLKGNTAEFSSLFKEHRGLYKHITHMTILDQGGNITGMIQIKDIWDHIKKSTFWVLPIFRRDISMLATQIPYKFGFKTEKITLEPIRIYFTLQFQNINYYNEHHYMNICNGEYKTMRYICDTAVNGTRMDLPVPWDITGNLTIVNFPARNRSARFDSMAQCLHGLSE